MEQDSMSDDELEDLEEGDRLGYYRGNSDSAGREEVVEVHDGVDTKVQPDDPSVEGGSVDVGEDSVVEGRHMVIPSSSNLSKVQK